MSTRERDQQAEQQRLQQEQQQRQQQEAERTGTPRAMQVEGDDESSNNPLIINK